MAIINAELATTFGNKSPDAFTFARRQEEDAEEVFKAYTGIRLLISRV